MKIAFTADCRYCGKKKPGTILGVVITSGVKQKIFTAQDIDHKIQEIKCVYMKDNHITNTPYCSKGFQKKKENYAEKTKVQCNLKK